MAVNPGGQLLLDGIARTQLLRCCIRTNCNTHPSLLGGNRSRRKSPPRKWSGPDLSRKCAGPGFTYTSEELKLQWHGNSTIL